MFGLFGGRRQAQEEKDNNVDDESTREQLMEE